MVNPSPNIDRVRRLVLDLLEAHGDTLAEVSRAIGKNHAYLHQFIYRGTPHKLPEEVRAALAARWNVPEARFRPGIEGLSTKDFAPDKTKPAKDRPEETEIPPRSQFIVEVDIRAGAGGGSLEERFEGDGKPLWYFPPEWVQAELRAKPADLCVMTIVGDSMISEPPTRRDLEPGDRVVVCISDTMPSPPGVFVVHDGLSLVAKRIEFVAHSEPPTVRIISNNADYETYERTLEEAHICGRIVGRWQRF